MVNYMDHTFMYLNEINNIITSLPMYVRVHVWVFIAERWSTYAETMGSNPIETWN